ncbi:MAG TPA: ATP-dependent DNA helicase [Gammaproteobacteria bacterium]
MNAAAPQPSEMDDWFGAGGRLESTLDGFQARAPQQAMASAVAKTLSTRGVLVAEAGTGTGKTFAYLLPVLLDSGRAIISTGTRHLQDQLFHRDLPALQAAIGRPRDITLLKGRANYLCRHRLDIAIQEAVQGGAAARRDVAQLDKVRQWSAASTSGDLVDLTALPEASPLRPRITSTAENCLGQDCPAFNDCFVLKARRRATEADVVVVNHHLLLADMVLKEEGFGEILPGADAIVIDEAHQLPELASQYFGSRISSRQLLNITRDAVAEVLLVAADPQALADQAKLLEQAVTDFLTANANNEGRLAWRDLLRDRKISAALENISARLGEFSESLEGLAEHSRGLENCAERATQALAALDELGARESPGIIRWAEIGRRHFVLHATPVDPAERFAAQVYGRQSAWIFTSATLSVGGSLKHFTQRTGLDEPREELFDSPFDYAENALLYVPDRMPETNTPAYTRAVVERALPLIRASRGRAFLLFTSHRALLEAASLLRDKIDYPLLVQGDMPRSHLLDRFRELGDAVLLGTSSFREGVDVRGPALSLVVIDKLPFASPDDPVLQARLAAIREAGGNPFFDYQVPQAVIGLKQGVGRLIRDVDDRGVMAICDPRLYAKSYGRIFLKSLPPMNVTRDAAETIRFLNSLD